MAAVLRYIEPISSFQLKLTQRLNSMYEG
jgi:hypothetical protein